MKKIDPRVFGLSSRINIQENNKNEIFFIIDRKSRVVMKDGIRVFDQTQKVKKRRLNSRFFLKTSAPVCSKTRKYLNQREIDVLDIKE
jgi:hypothetical protein